MRGALRGACTLVGLEAAEEVDRDDGGDDTPVHACRAVHAGREGFEDEPRGPCLGARAHGEGQDGHPVTELLGLQPGGG